MNSWHQFLKITYNLWDAALLECSSFLYWIWKPSNAWKSAYKWQNTFLNKEPPLVIGRGNAQPTTFLRAKSLRRFFSLLVIRSMLPSPILRATSGRTPWLNFWRSASLEEGEYIVLYMSNMNELCLYITIVRWYRLLYRTTMVIMESSYCR